MNGTIATDLVTEAFVPTAKGISTKDFQKGELFLWYDYFSCPQLESYVSSIEHDDPMDQSKSISVQRTTNSRLGQAVDSIPAYIARCAFFFVLCPVTWHDLAKDSSRKLLEAILIARQIRNMYISYSLV